MLTADEHLKELRRISTATLTAAKLAAQNEGLTLVNADRLAGLEKLAASVAEAFGKCKKTRCYEDCLVDGDKYNGKRWLFRRSDGDQMLADVQKLVQQACVPRDPTDDERFCRSVTLRPAKPTDRFQWVWWGILNWRCWRVIESGSWAYVYRWRLRIGPIEVRRRETRPFGVMKSIIDSSRP